MSVNTMIHWRRVVRGGGLPEDLIEELRNIARTLARRGTLPPSFAPYGSWNEESAEEVFASWYAGRLLGKGHLQALLDRASSPEAFKALAARSLRQHLVNSHDRSQVHNLYRRLISILQDKTTFKVIVEAKHPRDRWYAEINSTGSPVPWSEDDRALAAQTWRLGDFAIIRYGASARKLSPVLDDEELKRFAAALLGQTENAMTPAILMRALSGRFDLGDPGAAPIEEAEFLTPASSVSTDEEVVLAETARSIVDAMSERQRAVLYRASTEGIAEIAAALNCSNATVFNEQRRIGILVDRFSSDEEERDHLLKRVADLLYLDDDG